MMRTMSRCRTWLAPCVCLIWLVPVVQASTRSVPSFGYPDIQSAIWAAANGDIIEVADGIYTGQYNTNLSCAGKTIIIRSKNGPFSTIIDCAGSGSGVLFTDSVVCSPVLDGFTIRGAADSGIKCTSSTCTPTIANCVFEANANSGVSCNGSSPIITQCNFSQNTGTSGAGIYCIYSRPVIRSCIFTDNVATGGGGGVYIYSYDAEVTGCTFIGNRANGGGGLYCSTTTSYPLKLTNCLFKGNVATNSGGAVSAYQSQITNCTFTMNSAPVGGAIRTARFTTNVANSVLWGDIATSGPEIAVIGAATVQVSSCDVMNGQPGVYVASTATLTWGNGNMSIDPLFASSTNFHLSSDSPVIDAGDDILVPTGITTDLDGVARFYDGDGELTPTVDMGAYEKALPRVTVVPSLKRVFRDEVGVTGEESISIQCARGETESCQIIVANPGGEPVENINLTWTITGPVTITPYREYYAEVKTAPGHISAVQRIAPTRWEGDRYYPDGLIPFTDPYTADTPPAGAAQYVAAGYTLPKNQCQGYWLDFEVPADAPAGEYTGSVQVTALGLTQSIPVTLTVWDFAVQPGVEATLPVSVGCDWGRISSIYNATIPSQRFTDLLNRHYALLSSHRVIDLRLPTIPCDSQTGAALITDDLITAINQKVQANHLTICDLSIPISDALTTGWEKFKTYMRGIDAMLDAHPEIPPVFVYMVDEPNTPEEVQDIYKIGQFFSSEDIKVLNLVPGALQDSDPDYPLAGNIDVWVYWWAPGSDMDESAAIRQATPGNIVWTYTALANPPQVPTWELDAPVFDYMVPFWANWSLRFPGILYWTVILGADLCPDPWNNPGYSHYEAPESRFIDFNGEGSLLVPGTPAGVDGPLPTIRLKAMRDGVDSYAYLKLLASLPQGNLPETSQAAADRIAATVAASYGNWQSDYHTYITARQALAQEILARLQP